MQDVNVLKVSKKAVPLKLVKLNTVDRFALSQDPIAMQIQVHIQNAKVIENPVTKNTENYSVTQVLEYIEYIIEYGPDALNAYLGHKDRQLLGFRCAQMIQYYGVASVVDYIELVFDRKLKVFKKEKTGV